MVMEELVYIANFKENRAYMEFHSRLWGTWGCYSNLFCGGRLVEEARER